MIDKLIRSTLVVGLSVLLLGACHPQDTPSTEPVPDDLQVSAKLDSVITLTRSVDFSTVSETGQGPKGSLIRWEIPDSPTGVFQSFTYDQQSRLIGSIRMSYGYHEVRAARYQGTLLAEVIMGIRFDRSLPLSTIQPSSVAKYQYTADKQLTQVLQYDRLTDTDAFRLERVIQYEYTPVGQLALSRMIYPTGGGPTILTYWQNGDRIREETYYPLRSGDPGPVVQKTLYTYNQQPNPLAHLNLIPLDLVSEHYPTAQATYSYASVTNTYEPAYTYSTEYDYQQDTQGRLTAYSFRTSKENITDAWNDWVKAMRFAYAP